jgi:polyisoprenoid-binding protein YceI
VGILTALRRRSAALSLVVAAGSPAAALAAPPGHIRFEASNLITTAHGEFHDWQIVRAVVDEADPTRSHVELEVKVKSLDTDNSSRDEHLRSADFFDVEKFPTARVTLDGFRLDGADAFTADVTLAIRDKTKTFPMQFRIADRAARRIEGAVTLDRRDFGVGEPYSRWTPLSIHDEIQVKVEAIVPQADPGAPAGAAER